MNYTIEYRNHIICLYIHKANKYNIRNIKNRIIYVHQLRIIFAGYLRLAMIERTFENYQQRHEQNHETAHRLNAASIDEESGHGYL